MSVKLNTAWNLAGNGLPFLLGVITIPYLIHQIGLEAFGILSLIWVLIGYFSLFDFGLGRALTQQVATSLAVEERNNIAHCVKSGLLFTVVTGLAGGALLAGLAEPLATHWLKVSAPLQMETMHSLMIAGSGIPLTTAATGLKGVQEGYEDFKGTNFIRMGLGAGSFGLPALCAMLIGPSLIWMVISLVLVRLVVLVAHYVMVDKKLPDEWKQSKGSLQDIKSLLFFGIWMTSSNIIGSLMVMTDRFIIAATLGAGVVAYYTVPFDLLMRILIIPGAVSVALLPRLAAHFAVASCESKELYVRSIKLTALALALICGVIALSSYRGLAFWLGYAFAEQSWHIVILMSIGVFFNGISFIPLAAIQATGNAKEIAILHIIEFVFYVPLLFVFLHFFGITGAAIIWVIRVAIDLTGLMLLANRIFPSKNCSLILDTF